MQGLPEPRFEPPIEAVLAQGDEAIRSALVSGSATSLSEWYKAETERRRADFAEFAYEPVTIGDVTIAPGDWVEPSERVAGWRRTGGKVRTWRNCRYLGKLRGFAGVDPVLYFERWGANPDIYPKRDSLSRSAITAIAKIEPDEKLRNAIARREQADLDYAARRAESEALVRARRAEREAEHAE